MSQNYKRNNNFVLHEKFKFTFISAIYKLRFEKIIPTYIESIL